MIINKNERFVNNILVIFLLLVFGLGFGLKFSLCLLNVKFVVVIKKKGIR